MTNHHQGKFARDYTENVLSKLFEAENKRLEATLASLNKRNKAARDSVNGCDGFLLHGQFLMPRGGWAPAKGSPKVSLHQSLAEEGASFLLDREQIEADRKGISQILHLTLGTLDSYSQMRNALPECVVNLMGSLATMCERTEEPAYTIKDNPRAVRQWLKWLPKIESYSTSHLFY